MMKPQYTAGPWKTEGWEGLVVNAAGGTTMCLAAGPHGAELPELKANARLIAASPEMAEALHQAVKAHDDIMASNLPPLVKASFSALFNAESARAVLAKVEGRDV